MRRPYGVGLLVGGYDKATGAHLYRTCPSGNFYEYSAYAIGARSQSARTYLEKKYETFPDGMVLRVMLLTPVAAHKCLTLCGVCVAASVDELISHALKALLGARLRVPEISRARRSHRAPVQRCLWHRRAVTGWVGFAWGITK